MLDGLELGSRYTWDLAHCDLIGREPYYGPDSDTPYVFTFCGSEGYSGIRGLANEPGTDGTVRWAGCPLNTRKISVDLTVEPGDGNHAKRLQIADWSNVDIPLIPVVGKNHGSILTEPSAELVAMVQAALEVSDEGSFQAFRRKEQRLLVYRAQKAVMHRAGSHRHEHAIVR